MDYLPSSERLALINNLSVLLASGVPIIEAVDSLLSESKGTLKKILLKLKEDLNQGKGISYSFSKSPNVFDAVTVNIIKAAEESGTLETALKDLTINIKKDIEFSEKIKAAMLYPVLVVAVFIMVMLVILTFVIPRISQVFTKLQINLPLPTRILVALSNFVINYYPYIAIVSVALMIILFFLYRFKRIWLINLLYSLPLFSKLAIEIDIARFSRALYLLLSSGIPISQALKLSKNVVLKSEVRRAVAGATEIVESGKSLAEGFRKYKGTIPRVVVSIVEASEKSGALPNAMKEISEQFDEKVSNTLKSLTALLEPALLVVIGFMVGGVMLSVIAPIYGLIGQIGNR